MNRGYSLRQAQREILNVILSSSFPNILSLPRPVILSSSFPVILSSSKDDLRSKDNTTRRHRISDPVPLRQAQSDSEAQRDIFTVILSSSKDDLIERLRIGDPVTLRQAQSDIQPVILSSSKDDPIEGLKY